MKNYKENNILLWGIIFFSVGILLNIIIDTHFYKNESSSRMKFFENFFLNSLIAIILIPPIEELTFRGLFYRSKLKIFFYIGSFLFILVTKNFYLLFFLVACIILVEKKLFQKTKQNNSIVYIITSLIFALVHYRLSDFKSISTIITCLCQFGVSFVLIWITINFGLKKSILFHSFYNFILLFPVFISLQFFTSQYKSKYNNYELICNQTPILNRSSSFEWKNNLPQAKNMTLEDFYLSVCNDDTIKIANSDLKIKYDIKIINKENTNQNFDCRILKTMLQKIVIEKNKN